MKINQANYVLVIVSMMITMNAVWPETTYTPMSAAERETYTQALVDYYDAMSAPKPVRVLESDALLQHQASLRKRILEDIGLSPLPARIDLDVQRSEPIDHPWCTITKIQFQIWPKIYAEALLYAPKTLPETPAPAVLAPHGHWQHGFAHSDVQKRCLSLAKLGYVVLCPSQQHVEDLAYGLSHQTLMVWTNMRALDVLQAMPAVDPERIGAAGASGGGLQTQMIAALDERVKAATIVGFTCDFREIMFPHAAHCWCNHFPNVMGYTDHPEIAALAFPRPVQFLTMNDWTGHFMADNLPVLTALYRENGYPDNIACTYWPTPHDYARAKRERTYWWMEKWLKNDGDVQTAIPVESDDVVTIPPETLEQWPVANPKNKGIAALGDYFRQRPKGHSDPAELLAVLPTLLGLDNALPPETIHREKNGTNINNITIDRVAIASEGPLQLPAVIMHTTGQKEKQPITLVLSQAGSECDRETLDRYASMTHDGRIVTVVDVRFSGVYHLPDLAGKLRPDLSDFTMASPRGMAAKATSQQKDLLQAWERNSICWGYPLVGMCVTDIQHALAYLTALPNVDEQDITIVTRDLGHLAMAAVFAAALDARITKLDLDFQESCFAAHQPFKNAPHQFPVVPFLLQSGDVAHWLGLLQDRALITSNMSTAESCGCAEGDA